MDKILLNVRQFRYGWARRVKLFPVTFWWCAGNLSQINSTKRAALAQVFRPGPLEEVPARLITRPPLRGKTLLITDQEVQ